MPTHNFDIIGDLRGRACALRSLLDTLGYAERGGAYRHPSRHAVFLGGYLGGPSPVETLAIVWRMVGAGSATALMGRPEFRTVAFASADPASPTRHARPRRGEAWRAELDLLAPFGGPDGEAHRGLVALFAALPLWFETPNVRAVHACWDAAAARALSDHVDKDRRLIPEGLAAVLHGNARRHVETLLNGPEVGFPPGLSFRGADGRKRATARLRWWDRAAATYGEGLTHAGRLEGDGMTPLPPHAGLPAASPRPTVFGSHGLAGTPAVLGPLHACLDWPDGDMLCAYRFDGERDLRSVKLSRAFEPPPLAPPIPGPVASEAPPKRARRRRRPIARTEGSDGAGLAIARPGRGSPGTPGSDAVGKPATPHPDGRPVPRSRKGPRADRGHGRARPPGTVEAPP